MNEIELERQIPNRVWVSELHKTVAQFKSASRFHSILAIGFTWLGIFATLLIGSLLQSLWYLPICLILLAGFQHRFFTIYHEAYHSNLFPSTFWNTFAGKWFAAYPAATAYHGGRARHLAHHGFATQEKDPERTSHLRSWAEMMPLLFPWPQILMNIFNRLISRSEALVQNIPGRAPWDSAKNSSKKEIFLVLGYQIVLLAILIVAFGIWGFAYHLALVFVQPALPQLRQWVEHFNGDDENLDPRYVYIQSNVLERFFFAPMNFNYHGAHHHYPDVPFVHLPKVHELIDSKIPSIQRRSYLGTILYNLRVSTKEIKNDRN